MLSCPCRQPTQDQNRCTRVHGPRKHSDLALLSSFMPLDSLAIRNRTSHTPTQTLVGISKSEAIKRKLRPNQPSGAHLQTSQWQERKPTTKAAETVLADEIFCFQKPIKTPISMKAVVRRSFPTIWRRPAVVARFRTRKTEIVTFRVAKKACETGYCLLSNDPSEKLTVWSQ